MACRLSVIIPNRNGENTIGLCLEALFNSAHDSFEVIVVDDCSTDNSISIIKNYPCKIINLEQHSGAAHARNRGAEQSRGELLFFLDADCLVFEDTLALAEKALGNASDKIVVGGTYTLRPYDQTFYSTFQSVYIHYSELKNIHHPDYVAAHAMVISARVFHQSGGFPNKFLPIIEDVEFSHRLRRNGRRLFMQPELQVRHIFGFRSMVDSLRNGFRKSKYWVMYSLGNKDLLSDSGTASYELKANVFALFGSFCLLVGFLVTFKLMFLLFLGALFCGNVLLNRKLFSLFYKSGGSVFLVTASAYYIFIYPLAVGAGAMMGTMYYFLHQKTKD